MPTIGDLIADKEAKNNRKNEENKKRLEDLSLSVTNGLELFLSGPEEYKKYLRMQGMEPRRSVRNAILTAMGKPAATLTQTPQAWSRCGGKIKDSEREKGILVFDGTYGTKKEYDISQTYGAKVNTPADLSNADLEKMVENMLYISGAQLVADDKLEQPALYNPEDKKVHIRPDLEASTLIPHILPEIVYAKLNRNSSLPFFREDFQFEAESIQYMLCQRFGFEMQEPNFDGVWNEFAGLSDNTRISFLDSQRNVTQELRQKMERGLEIGPQEKNQRNYPPKGR